MRSRLAGSVSTSAGGPTLGERFRHVKNAHRLKTSVTEYAAILTVFGHRSGAASATQVLRGLLLGLFGFAGFFLVLALLIERTGLAPAFAGAIAATLAIQTASLVFVLRAPKALGATGP